MSKTEAAAYLRISVPTFDKWVRVLLKNHSKTRRPRFAKEEIVGLFQSPEVARHGRPGRASSEA